MRVFHSELAINPSLYSFGYSTYAYLEEGDDLSECYQKGFLPFVGVREEKTEMLFMARGSRVRVDLFEESSENRRIDRRVKARFGTLDVQTHQKEEFDRKNDLLDFLVRHFASRFGREAMPRDRLNAMLASPLLTHIIEYRTDNGGIAYSLETQGRDFFHLWHIAYAPELRNSNFGAYMFLDFVRRARSVQKKYAYLGITCGANMHIKTYFQPLEYWNGNEWVRDPKSVQLKKLLASDATRVLALTDEWRDDRHPYHPAPIRFESGRAELRFLATVLYGLPRTASLIIGLCAGFAIVFVLTQVVIMVR